MNPQINIEIIDRYGSHAELTDEVSCPYDVYVNDEKVCTSERIDALEAENDKLRELVRDMRKAFFTLDIDHCQACPRDTINGPCTKYIVGGSDECDFDRCMRELGIEADE